MDHGKPLVQEASDPRVQRRAEAGLLALTLIWGATFVIVKQALPDVGVNTYVALRFSLAAVAGAILAPRALLRMTPRLALHCGILGILLYGGFVLQTVGLRYTTVANSGFFTGTMAVFTPLIEIALLRRWPKWNHVTAIGIVTVGLFLLSSPEVAGLNPGDVMTLGCAVVFASYIVLLDRFAPQHDLWALTIYQMAAVAVIAWIAMPFVSSPPTIWAPALWLALLYGAIMATLLTTFAQTKLQPRTTATKAAIIFTAEPLFAAFFGYVVLGETMSGRGMLGASLIIGGLLVSEFVNASRAAAERPLDDLARGT